MPTIKIKRNSSTGKLLYSELGFNTSTKRMYIGSSTSATSTASTSMREVGRPIITLSQTDYNALSTKDSNTIYIIQTPDSILTNSVLTNQVAEIQTQINTLNTAVSGVATLVNNLSSKQNTVTGSATSALSSNLGASKILISTSAQKLGASSIATTTELGYLDGVTSSIQTQLDNKLNSGTLAIANGGTGATTASAARTNLGLKYTKLWSGNMYSGSMDVNCNGYDFLVITGRVSSTFGTQSLSMPLAYLTSTAEKWQLADDEYYVAFTFAKSSSNVVTIKYSAGTSNGRIQSIYGIKVGG